MKGTLSQDTARLMVFKLVMAGASKTWRRLQDQNQSPKVIRGVKFRDGIEVAPEAKSAGWFTPSPKIRRSSGRRVAIWTKSHSVSQMSIGRLQKISTYCAMTRVRGRGAADRSILSLSSRLSGVAPGF